MTHKMCHFLFIIKKYIIVIKLHFSFSILYIIMFVVGEIYGKRKEIGFRTKQKRINFLL